jgi:hypothetical protein
MAPTCAEVAAATKEAPATRHTTTSPAGSPADQSLLDAQDSKCLRKVGRHRQVYQHPAQRWRATRAGVLKLPVVLMLPLLAHGHG